MTMAVGNAQLRKGGAACGCFRFAICFARSDNQRLHVDSRGAYTNRVSADSSAHGDSRSARSVHRERDGSRQLGSAIFEGVLCSGCSPTSEAGSTDFVHATMATNLDDTLDYCIVQAGRGISSKKLPRYTFDCTNVKASGANVGIIVRTTIITVCFWRPPVRISKGTWRTRCFGTICASLDPGL